MNSLYHDIDSNYASNRTTIQVRKAAAYGRVFVRDFVAACDEVTNKDCKPVILVVAAMPPYGDDSRSARLRDSFVETCAPRSFSDAVTDILDSVSHTLRQHRKRR